MKPTFHSMMVLAGASLATATAALAAPTYTYPQIGTFGTDEFFHNTSSTAVLVTSGDYQSSIFTAKEAVTVDRVYQTFSEADGTATTVKVYIAPDNGSGQPDLDPGDIIRQSASVLAVNGTSAITFPSLTLVEGQKYHVVTELQNPGTGDVRVHSSSTNFPIRPYDRATDTTMQSGRRTAADGNVWIPIGIDPSFYFGNGSNVVGGPGMAISNYTYSTVYTQGGATHGQNGERFVIQESEVPAGTELIVNQITLYPLDVSTSQNLLVRIRDANNPNPLTNILGTAVLTPAAALGGFLPSTITFNQPVHLFQGAPYLITTEFEFPNLTTSAEHYLLLAAHTSLGAGEAGWGGTTNSFAITSSNNWTTWSALNAPDHDLRFSFTALVPEPGSAMALVGLAGVALARRRARRA